MVTNKLLWATLCVFFLFSHYCCFPLCCHIVVGRRIEWKLGVVLYFSCSGPHFSRALSHFSPLLEKSNSKQKWNRIKQDVENIFKLDYIFPDSLWIFNVLVDKCCTIHSVVFNWRRLQVSQTNVGWQNSVTSILKQIGAKESELYVCSIKPSIPSLLDQNLCQ